jgi:hypothetical protein
VASRSASGTEPRERTKLLAALTGIMVLATVTLLVVRHPLIVEWPVIAGIATPWVGISIGLRVRAKTWGKERPVVDWWSVPHFIAGVLFGLFGIGGVLVLAIAVLWECVELVSRVTEYPTNRIADVAFAISGWILANLVGGGPFTAW